MAGGTLVVLAACGLVSEDEPPQDAGPEARPAVPSEAPTGRPIDDPTSRQFLRLDAGTVVRDTGRASGKAVAVLASDASARLLQGSPPWYQIQAGDPATVGWVHLSDEAATARLLRVREAHRQPRVSSAPDRQALAAARRHMPGAREARCGPYLLLTNEDDTALLTACDQLAAGLDQAYAERYGVRPLGQPGEAIVLFARLGEFRAFVAERSGVAPGYAAFAQPSDGYLAMHAESPRRTTLQTLVHELSHLIHRRALGDLPRWLSEGLADGLGDTATEQRLLPAEGIVGAEAQAGRLLQARQDRRAGSIESLVTQADTEFDRGTVSFDYEASALLVRYLLDQPRFVASFQAFLRDVSTGERADAGQLRNRLGVSWDRLDRAFHDWLTLELEK